MVIRYLKTNLQGQVSNIALAVAVSVLSTSIAVAEAPKNTVQKSVSPAAKQEAEALASRAETLLNQWQGERGILIEADKAINDALSRDPASAHAMVERARLLIMASSREDGRLLPQGAAAVAEVLEKAAKADPGFVRTYTLQGHFFTLEGRMNEAKKALEHADQLGSKDPWQALNWSAYWQKLGDEAKAVSYCDKALETGTSNVKALRAGWTCILDYYTKQKPNLKRSDKAFLNLVKLNPESAFLRGDRAQALAVYFTEFDAAEKLARETIAISSYPHVRGTLSLALYAKWARAIFDNKDDETINALLNAAEEVDPEGSMLPSCAVNRPEFSFLRRALAKRAETKKIPLNLRAC